MSRALVTGAAGFLGGHLCRRLVDDGVEVHGLSRRPQSSRSGVEWWQGDLADSSAIERIVADVKPDVIFHAAGYTSASRGLDALLPSLRDIVVASVNLLVAAARSGPVPVVVAGSLEEPEPGADGVASSAYAVAKQAATAYGRMLVALHELPVVNLRLFMVYGPDQKDRRKLIPYVVNALLSGERPNLSSGSRPVDWVYVEDVVDAFVLAGQRPELAGEPLDVGSGKLVTVRDVVQMIVEAMGSDLEPHFGAVPDRPRETVRAADVETTRANLGWQPRTALADGIGTTIDWYRMEFERRSAS